MPMQLAREKAAQAWCQPRTEKLTFDPDLAEEFAKILYEYIKEANEPWLGLATAGQILDELRARCEVDGTIDKRAVD